MQIAGCHTDGLFFQEPTLAGISRETFPGRKYNLPAQQKTRAQGSAHGKFRVSAIRENKYITRQCETRKYQSEN